MKFTYSCIESACSFAYWSLYGSMMIVLNVCMLIFLLLSSISMYLLSFVYPLASVGYLNGVLPSCLILSFELNCVNSLKSSSSNSFA